MDNLDQILNPDSASLWRVILAAVAIGLSFFVARFVRRRTRSLVTTKGIDESSASLIARLAGWSAIFLGVVLGLSILGVDMVPVVLLIILVLAFFAFSGRSLVENWAAGLLLQARSPYEIGDRIDTEGQSGYVVETNARTLILRTADGQIVHVPNTDVLNNVLVNRSGEGGLRRSSIVFGVATESDFADVERVLVDVASATDGVLAEPTAPAAFIAGVTDTVVNVELRFWHAYGDRHRVRSEVSATALEALARANVKMPFPTRELLVSGSIEGRAT